MKILESKIKLIQVGISKFQILLKFEDNVEISIENSFELSIDQEVIKFNLPVDEWNATGLKELVKLMNLELWDLEELNKSIKLSFNNGTYILIKKDGMYENMVYSNQFKTIVF